MSANPLSRFLARLTPPAALPSPEAAPQEPKPLATTDTAARYRITTAIPSGALVAGDLALIESAIIGGVVEGKVVITGEKMAAFVKKGALIKGGVRAAVVLIYGEVHGVVEGDYVRVYAGGCVRGTIQAESMIVDRGALYLGAETRVAPPVTSAPPAPPIDAVAERVEVRDASAAAPTAASASAAVLPMRRRMTPEDLKAELARLRGEQVG